METLIPKLIPDAISAAALLAAFIIFLKDRREWNKTLKSISDSCHQRQEQAQKSFESALRLVTNLATTELRTLGRKVDQLNNGVSRLLDREEAE